MLEILYAGPTVTLGRWRCTHPAAEWSELQPVTIHEIVVPLRGQWVRRHRGVEELANANATLCASPGESYRVRHPDQEPDVCGVVLVREAAVTDLAQAVGRDLTDRAGSFVRSMGSLPSEGYLAFGTLVARSARGECDPVEIEETLGRVMGAALAGPRPASSRRERSTTARNRDRAVRSAEEFLTARFREPMTLQQVAEAAGYSPFHLARMFRSRVGLTIHRYLTRLRLRESLQMILDGEQNLSRLAHELGFSSHSHFTRAFRREYGRTPSGVRVEAQ